MNATRSLARVSHYPQLAPLTVHLWCAAFSTVASQGIILHGVDHLDRMLFSVSQSPVGRDTVLVVCNNGFTISFFGL